MKSSSSFECISRIIKELHPRGPKGSLISFKSLSPTSAPPSSSSSSSTTCTTSLLHNPLDYYNTLREQIKKAQHSITLSALYLGSGHLENALVVELDEALTNRQLLTVTVILDYSRAKRSSGIAATTTTSSSKAIKHR